MVGPSALDVSEIICSARTTVRQYTSMRISAYTGSVRDHLSENLRYNGIALSVKLATSMSNTNHANAPNYSGYTLCQRAACLQCCSGGIFKLTHRLKTKSYA